MATSPQTFKQDVELDWVSAHAERWGCAGGCTCRFHQRRWFTGALLATAALPVWAQEPAGVDVGKESKFTRLVPAAKVEESAQSQYQQLLKEASSKQALGPPSHPQVQRLNAIAQRIIPFTPPWNGRAKAWRWEVNLIGSKQINAFCMPGGKIAFYSGILEQLKLTDDEVAMIMGHEMAHALREHARERMGKELLRQGGTAIAAWAFGLGQTGTQLLNSGTQILGLKWSRGDESEADLVGLDLAARAGYDPRSGVSLWKKMMSASGGKAPMEFLSTHPAGDTRIADIEKTLPRVMPLFEQAAKPPRRWDPAG